jgi:hypothetical protein
MSTPLPGQLELPLPGASPAPYVAGSETSREAAEWQDRTGAAANLELQTLYLFAYAGAGGLTDEELDAEGAMSVLPFKRTLRPRRVALWHKGFIDAAPGGKTRRTSTGRQAVVWVITPKGEGCL